jgi:hypothetical protein
MHEASYVRERIRAIPETIASGQPFTLACREASIDPSRALEWIARGRKGESPFDKFARAVDRAYSTWADKPRAEITADG